MFPFTPIAQNVVCTYVALCFLTTKIISCPQEWKKLHMKDFLAMTNGFMHELEQPESKTRVETYESFMQQHEQPASGTQVEGWELHSAGCWSTSSHSPGGIALALALVSPPPRTSLIVDEAVARRRSCYAVDTVSHHVGVYLPAIATLSLVAADARLRGHSPWRPMVRPIGGL